MLSCAWTDYDDFKKKGYFEPTEWAKIGSLSRSFDGLAVIIRMEPIDMNPLESMRGMWSYHIIGFWQKIELIQELRKRRNGPTMGEWLEWLANELKKREQQLGKVW